MEFGVIVFVVAAAVDPSAGSEGDVNISVMNLVLRAIIISLYIDIHGFIVGFFGSDFARFVSNWNFVIKYVINDADAD